MGERQSDKTRSIRHGTTRLSTTACLVSCWDVHKYTHVVTHAGLSCSHTRSIVPPRLPVELIAVLSMSRLGKPQIVLWRF
jgi:hypothetical protein